MGSKIKKSRLAYNVLLLRDNSTITSFRLSAFKLKALLLLFFLLLLFAAVSGYGVHYYRTLHMADTHKIADLNAQNRDMQLRLQRLAGVETFLQTARNTDTASVSGNAAHAVAGDTPVTQQDSTSVPTAREIESILDPLGSATKTAQEAAHHIPELLQTYAAASGLPAPRENAASLSNSADNVTALPPQNQNTVQQEHPAILENVRVIFPNERTMRLTFDLRNGEPGDTLSGSCKVSIHTASGAMYDLTPSPAGAMSFSINNFKTMDGTFSLPEGVTGADVVSVEVIPEAKGISPVTRSFPVSNAQLP